MCVFPWLCCCQTCQLYEQTKNILIVFFVWPKSCFFPWLFLLIIDCTFLQYVNETTSQLKLQQKCRFSLWLCRCCGRCCCLCRCCCCCCLCWWCRRWCYVVSDDIDFVISVVVFVVVVVAVVVGYVVKTSFPFKTYKTF